MDKIRDGVTLAHAALGEDWEAAAKAIMTTDTRPKMAFVEIRLDDGRCCRLAGIAKGAGMIAPNMATMLGTVVTDAVLTPAQAKDLLTAASELTFNRIVVDGDMSTNDTVLLLANGASGVTLDTTDVQVQFRAALRMLCRKLAQDIVRDGEGVTKFLTITVLNAPDDAAARQIANTIATSALVKTAFYGGDANWGRIIAAAGRAGVPLDLDLARLWFTPGETDSLNDHSLLLFADGIAAPYDEARATAIVQGANVSIALDCGAGGGTATVWTCDLSHDYVSINGHYRT
jgi:glutamate N-acetyltransferase/amino-acid N-acetyltransferase